MFSVYFNKNRLKNAIGDHFMKACHLTSFLYCKNKEGFEKVFINRRILDRGK